jgi:hypothetical protein
MNMEERLAARRRNQAAYVARERQKPNQIPAAPLSLRWRPLLPAQPWAASSSSSSSTACAFMPAAAFSDTTAAYAFSADSASSTACASAFSVAVAPAGLAASFAVEVPAPAAVADADAAAAAAAAAAATAAGEDDPDEEEPVASATYGNKSPCIRTGDQFQAVILPALVPSTCLERGDTLVWSATCMGAAGMGGVALDAYLTKSLALVGGPPQQPPTYTSAQQDFPIELALAALHACGGDAAAALAQLQRSSGGSGEAWSTVEVRRLHAALARSKTVDLRSVRDHVMTKDLKAVVRLFYVVDGERKKEHRDKERERYDLEQGGQAHPDADCGGDAGRFVWSCRFCSRAFEDESSATVHGKQCVRDAPQQADRLPPCMLMASLVAC